MASYPFNEQGYTLEHDPPSELVDFAIQELNSQHALAFTTSEWEQLSKERPHLRDFISRVAFDIAPEDLNLREKVTRAILGYSVVLNETNLVNSLEELLEVIPQEGTQIPNN